MLRRELARGHYGSEFLKKARETCRNRVHALPDDDPFKEDFLMLKTDRMSIEQVCESTHWYHGEFIQGVMAEDLRMYEDERYGLSQPEIYLVLRACLYEEAEALRMSHCPSFRGISSDELSERQALAELAVNDDGADLKARRKRRRSAEPLMLTPQEYAELCRMPRFEERCDLNEAREVILHAVVKSINMRLALIEQAVRYPHVGNFRTGDAVKVNDLLELCEKVFVLDDVECWILSVMLEFARQEQKDFIHGYRSEAEDYKLYCRIDRRAFRRPTGPDGSLGERIDIALRQPPTTE